MIWLSRNGKIPKVEKKIGFHFNQVWSKIAQYVNRHNTRPWFTQTLLFYSIYAWSGLMVTLVVISLPFSLEEFYLPGGRKDSLLDNASYVKPTTPDSYFHLKVSSLLESSRTEIQLRRGYGSMKVPGGKYWSMIQQHGTHAKIWILIRSQCTDIGTSTPTHVTGTKRN